MIRLDDPRFQHHVSPFRVELDWKACWQEFKESHGGDPVPYLGRLLFRDGWQHSASDYKGPEFPPRIEDIPRLQLIYWAIRKRVVRRELLHLEEMVAQLRSLEQYRSSKLMQRLVVLDDESGKRRAQAVPLDIDALEKGRVAWLRQDLKDCQAMMDDLRKVVKAQGRPGLDPEGSDDKTLDQLLATVEQDRSNRA